jgi:hypothetical protein
MEIKIQESDLVESAVQLMQDDRNKMHAMQLDIDRLNAENVKNSILFEMLKNHLSIFLCEIEERFNRTSEFDSDTICEDYIKSALFMQENFGRKNNRIFDAKYWYDNHSLPFKS